MLASPPMPTSLRALAKRRTREALVDAALSCFSEQGLDNPSLDAICARAGCTRGAFYVHFKDRDDLIAAAMERRRGALLASFFDAPLGAASLLDILDLFAAAVDHKQFPVAGAVRTGELLAACKRSKKIRAAQVSLMHRTHRRIEQLVERDRKGPLRSDLDPAAVATLLLILEAGAEVVLDIGYPLDAKSVATALAHLLSPPHRARSSRTT